MGYGFYTGIVKFAYTFFIQKIWMDMKCSFLIVQLSNYSSFDGTLYCKPHFDQLFKMTGSLEKSFESGMLLWIFNFMKAISSWSSLLKMVIKLLINACRCAEDPEVCWEWIGTSPFRCLLWIIYKHDFTCCTVLMCIEGYRYHYRHVPL